MNETGLGLRFGLGEDGAVEAHFRCEERFQGYRNWLHGGSIAAVLDGAMTNCLFAAGIVAVTAELKVRFRQPLRTGIEATVRAWTTRRLGSMHVVRAEIRQQGKLAAAGTGRFMEHTPGLCFTGFTAQAGAASDPRGIGGLDKCLPDSGRHCAVPAMSRLQRAFGESLLAPCSRQGEAL